ncbi:amidohydrolase [Bacteroides sp. 51]|uniref:amidohydrolase n=1 Tax=Bacteroides sp. 51 TaxID=2302938 RepID=UPI0013D11383|nr:amidohydrolase [Bacteroides sp. 51]NDV81482.1 amidohydrolase [Bacteroides sp. 51]
MRISILQTDIIWENKEDNLNRLRNKLEELRGKTDIAILPEMFSTGFTMRSKELAEPVDGYTITTLRSLAVAYGIALVGSYIAYDNGHYYNRAFFLTPNSEAFYYDKKHLFRMGHEEEYFSAGDKKIIIPYQGWNICLLVCYELRFPVWSRNVQNEYDLLIYVANWPTARRLVWDTLLAARAIENMTYVCGANRVGTDGNKLNYNGGSAIYSPKGKAIAMATDDQEDIITMDLSLDQLNAFRQKFPVWLDADKFEIQS